MGKNNSKYPARVTITDVAPRDGLQNEKVIVSAEDKIKFIGLLADAGISHIEATSFVGAKYVPQFADAGEIFPKLPRKDGLRYLALVPNMRGLQNAIAAGVNGIVVFVAASDTFNKKNINMSTDEALKEAGLVVREAKKNKMFARGVVATSFFCPYEEKIEVSAAAGIAKHYADFGCDQIGFGDTTGRATPLDVGKLLEAALAFLPVKNVYMHFHDTRGCGLANVLKSLEYNVALFDASTGGLGGCPYAPGASGNIDMGNLLYMLHGMGIRTGISIEAVIEAKRFIESVLKN